MGAAGADGFGPSPCGADVEDAGQDGGVGNEDCYAGDHDVESSQNEDCHLNMIAARAGEILEGDDVTEVMTDEELTVGQFQHEASLYG